MLRRGALLNFDKQNGGEQNPIHSYTNCASVNDLVMLLCSIQLTYRIHPGVSHGFTFNLIPNRMGSCHGQISIETATYSWFHMCVSLHLTITVSVGQYKSMYLPEWQHHLAVKDKRIRPLGPRADPKNTCIS